MPVSVRVVLPAAMVTYANGQREVEVQADSVRTAVETLVDSLPDLKPHLLTSTGKLQPFVNLFLNNDHVRDLDQHEITLTAGSELLIVSALAGG